MFIQKSRKNEKAEKSGTAEKERKKGEKTEIFRKKQKRWQPCFRLNPQNKRDQHGAQASFRLEKHLTEIFVNASNKDIEENLNK